MRNLAYGSWTILVSDDVADAVLHYSAVLGQLRSSDVVDVPTIDDAGFAATAGIILGVGIPVMTTPAPDDVLEETYPVFVEELTARIASALADRSQLH
jgi:tripartite-type tricarboxylate transporter receptor subunit TctC